MISSHSHLPYGSIICMNPNKGYFMPLRPKVKALLISTMISFFSELKVQKNLNMHISLVPLIDRKFLIGKLSYKKHMITFYVSHNLPLNQ